MTKLDELIEELCPEGVEWKTLDLLVENKTVKIVTPTFKIKRNDYKQIGETPIISQEIEYISGYCDLHDSNILKRNYVCFGDHSEHIKYIDFAFVQGADGLKIMYTDENVLNAKFFYHAISSLYRKHNNYERHFKYLCDLQLPIPPLQVQNEIVRILDKFTLLEAELEAELEARREQYEYYRDSLLTFDDGVEWKTLGEVANKITDGMHNLPKCISEKTDYPIISAQNINNGLITFETNKYVTSDVFNVENKRTSVALGDVLLTIVGAIGRSAVVKTEQKMLFQRSVCVIKPKQDLLDSSYLKYIFDSKTVQNYIQRNAQGAAQKGIYLDSVKKIKIPLPSLTRQNEIVKILDRFESLCNDISTGLPAEIKARHQQYEYYRDKLLSFKRK